MVDYSKKLISDLPEQFRGRERIEALMAVIGKQMQDIQVFYEQLNFQRSLSNATGAQLDAIGDILCLTRKEASMISEQGAEFAMDDTDYRAILGYKIMLNYGDATYYDIVRGIKNFCNRYPIRYSESLEYPASFFLELEVEEGREVILRNLLPVKAAGVNCSYQFRLSAYVEVSSEVTPYTAEVPQCGQHLCGTVPIRATLGNSQNADVEVDIGTESTVYEPVFTGTKPVTATQGYSQEANVQADAVAEPITYATEQSGTENCGTYPEVTTNGYTSVATVSIDSQTEATAYQVGEAGEDECGTKP